MPSRHKAREQALQVLFQWDARKNTARESIDAFYGSLSSEDAEVRTKRDAFLETLVNGTVAQIVEIDSQITRHAEHWRLERMPAVDRNILRLAVFELLHTDTPAPVLIDEAIELARRFSGKESVQFVNGVLDAVRRDNEANQKQAPGHP
jgi:transcription antitermination protein NusB